MVIAAMLLVAAPARSQRAEMVPPTVAADVVRFYFDAFRRLDRPTLVALTDGQAAERTSEIIDHIESEAARRDVGVELKLHDLALTPQPDGAVDVKFDIAVIAKKWFLSTVAKQLRGRATFFVGGARLARGDVSRTRITGIEFTLD
jgi:hypothetical protein